MLRDSVLWLLCYSYGAAKENLQANYASTKQASAETTDATSQRAGDAWEGTKQTVSDYAKAASDKVAGAKDYAAGTLNATKEVFGQTTNAAKEKASAAIGGLQNSANSASDTAQEKAGEASDNMGVTWDNVRHRYADSATMAKAKASETASTTSAVTPAHESDTRKASAGEVADVSKYTSTGPKASVDDLKTATSESAQAANE